MKATLNMNIANEVEVEDCRLILAGLRDHRWPEMKAISAFAEVYGDLDGIDTTRIIQGIYGDKQVKTGEFTVTDGENGENGEIGENGELSKADILKIEAWIKDQDDVFSYRDIYTEFNIKNEKGEPR